VQGPQGPQGPQGSAGASGAILGQLSCPGNDYTGFLVHIPGRAFNVYTGPDGAFQIDTVPAGTYTVAVLQNGQQKATAQAVVTTVPLNIGQIVLNDLTTDANNCGTCGNACGGAGAPNVVAGCVAGACSAPTCVQGFADCNQSLLDGCEVNVNISPNNCGACGKQCLAANATSGCSQGMCTLAACLPGFGDCDGQVANGCEVNLLTSVNNCGGCGKVCGPGAPASCNGNTFISASVPVCSGGVCGTIGGVQTPCMNGCNPISGCF
jgi:hypothetical protein